jgi:hypothetical protein
MARILEDADVGARPFAGELNVLQVKEPVVGAGPSRGLSGAVEDDEIALQAQPIAPVPVLTPADQIGGAVEAIPHEPHRRSRRHPGRHGFKKRLLRGEANRPFGRLDPPRQEPALANAGGRARSP